jgi:hypothetical protein
VAAGKIVHQRIEPGAVDLAILTDQQGRADLDHEALCCGERGSGSQ